ncbi:MAG: hypothetical protein SO253_06325 [Bacilli bacterium]|nr:hypothetical protein [Bacilli bacterium]
MKKRYLLAALLCGLVLTACGPKDTTSSSNPNSSTPDSSTPDSSTPSTSTPDSSTPEVDVELFTTIDWATKNSEGFDSYTVPEINVTNTDGSTVVVKKNSACYQAKFNADDSIGATMAMNFYAKAPEATYLEFDMGENVVKQMDVDFRVWSEKDLEQMANNFLSLAIQQWVDDAWVEVVSVTLEELSAAEYTNKSVELNSSKIRFYGEKKPDANTTNARLVVDNIKLYK